MLDLLIRGGLIIDGTGNPGFYGAVAVEDERVPHPARRHRRASRPGASSTPPATWSAPASSTCTRTPGW